MWFEVRRDGATARADLQAGADRLKIGVLSDTHGYVDHRIEAVISHCDAVIHAGDVCGDHVLEDLAALCPRVFAVAGNNDAATRWRPNGGPLSRLPEDFRLALPGGELVVEHGHRFGNHPDHQALRDAWPDARLVIYGHTHRQVVDQDAAPWVINPGAAGRTRTGKGPSCIVLTVNDSGEWDLEPMRFEDTARQVA